MKKIICFIFGHDGHSYDAGSVGCPEEGWMCFYCGKILEYGDDNWGLNLNNRVTNFLANLGNKENYDDLPF